MSDVTAEAPPADDLPDDADPPSLDEPAEDPAEAERTVGWMEAAMLFVAAGVGLTAWVSLVLAQIDGHDLPQVTLLTALALTAVVVIAWRHPSRPRFRFDLTELLLVVAIAVVSVVMYSPGFPYAFTDKDPGVYVSHGMAISREGTLSYYDEIADAALDRSVQHTLHSGSRFPGFWTGGDSNPTEVLPQFYHQWPALLGTAADIGGFGAVANLTPVLAGLSTIAVVLAIRRGVGRNRFGTAAAAFAGLLLATNMLQVWQAKSPSTEILTQLYLAGATLAVVIAIRSRWALAAGLAGMLTGLMFQVRADGFLLVLLAIGVGGVIYALGRWDRRATWFAVGMALPLPTAIYQAFWAAEIYSEVNSVPSLPKLVGVVLLVVVGAVVGRRLLSGRLSDQVRRVSEPVALRRAEYTVGIALVAVYGLLLILGWFRPTLLGEDFFLAQGVTKERSYDEINLLRLSWFFTPFGLIVMWAGLCVVALRRWNATIWALVVPGLVLLPIYVWNARVSPQLMWWGRRFVPVVIVAVVALIAIALAWTFTRRGRWRLEAAAASLVALAVLLSFQLSQSWTLREHREFGGSIGLIERISAQADGEQELFIWVGEYRGLYRMSRNLGGPLWFIEDQLSVILDEPRNPNDLPENLIEDYAAEFPDKRVFLIGEGDDPPPGFDAARLTPLDRIVGTMPLWDQPVLELPRDPHPGLPINLSIWEWQR